jgi:hypothetical protein
VWFAPCALVGAWAMRVPAKEAATSAESVQNSGTDADIALTDTVPLNASGVPLSDAELVALLSQNPTPQPPPPEGEGEKESDSLQTQRSSVGLSHPSAPSPQQAGSQA